MEQVIVIPDDEDDDPTSSELSCYSGRRHVVKESGRATEAISKTKDDVLNGVDKNRTARNTKYAPDPEPYLTSDSESLITEIVKDDKIIRADGGLEELDKRMQTLNDDLSDSKWEPMVFVEKLAISDTQPASDDDKEIKFLVSERKRTGLVYDEMMSKHYHMWNDKFTEKPERILEPYKKCQEYGLVERCRKIEARFATEEEMKSLHNEEIISDLKLSSELSEPELRALSMKYDYLYFHNDVYDSARLAMGSSLELVDHILNGEISNGLAIMRPPGHHAMQKEMAGYCYLNNVAVAAKHAIEKHGLNRVFILDWDVHHGQGTQYLFYDDPKILYISVHKYLYGREWPCLRQGDYDYIGEGKGTGFNINVPMNEIACGNSDYLAIFFQLILPVAYEFDPELILVSAGYDAAIGCPEGEMEITPACYAHFISLLSSLANGKICLLQEGGYCIKSLSEGIALSLRALLGDPTPVIAPVTVPRQSVIETILNVIKVHRPYWKSLQFQGKWEPDQTSFSNEILKWPPRSDVEFFTDSNRPDRYSIYQDCYSPQYEQVREFLMQRIDLLIQETSLKTSTHKVALAYDDRVLLHKDLSSTGWEECPERVSAVCRMLKKCKLWNRCYELEPREATIEELTLFHSKEYVKQVLKTVSMDSDTLIRYQNTFKSMYLCQDTYHSATAAVGSLLSVVDSVLSGEAQSGLAVIRPPGHHAQKSLMMGFCVFNNVAVAASYVKEKYGLKRILVLDWDIHHGNGIQSAFYDDPSILFISLHRYDDGSFYPYGGGGFQKRTGSGPGEGYNVNIPFNKGPKGDADYIAAFHQIVLPIAYEFHPDLVIVAAGFDAAIDDPLGGYHVSPNGFAHMTQMVRSLSNGKLILSLEGGYSPESMSKCVSACVSVLLDDPCPILPSLVPSAAGVETICNVLDTQKLYWKSLQFRAVLPESKPEFPVDELMEEQ